MSYKNYRPAINLLSLLQEDDLDEESWWSAAEIHPAEAALTPLFPLMVLAYPDRWHKILLDDENRPTGWCLTNWIGGYLLSEALTDVNEVLLRIDCAERTLPCFDVDGLSDVKAIAQETLLWRRRSAVAYEDRDISTQSLNIVDKLRNLSVPYNSPSYRARVAIMGTYWHHMRPCEESVDALCTITELPKDEFIRQELLWQWSRLLYYLTLQKQPNERPTTQ